MFQSFLKVSLAPTRRLVPLVVAGAWFVSGAASATEASNLNEGSGNPPVSEEALEAWLDAEPGVLEAKADKDRLAVPIVAPRKHGVVIETGMGALGHIGSMSHVSPTSPFFRLQVGLEVLDWLMVLGQSDLCISDTRYAGRAVESRPYALFGGGLGLRLAWQALPNVAFTLQGDTGFASVDEDVLETHGYRQSTELRNYYSGVLGIDWYQVSPHYALRFFGGARSYRRTFRRVAGDPRPLAWLGGISLRYAL